MRIMFLLPLALAAVAAASGCGTASEGTEQASSRVPRRDLDVSPGGAGRAGRPAGAVNQGQVPAGHRRGQKDSPAVHHAQELIIALSPGAQAGPRRLRGQRPRAPERPPHRYSI